MNYASFQKRASAAILDSFVLAPIALAYIFAPSLPPGWLLVVSIAYVTLSSAYPVVGHACFGQTLGKRWLKIRVVTVDGGRIGWGQSIRRSSVDAVFTVLTIGLFIITVSELPAEFVLAGFEKRDAMLEAVRVTEWEWLRWTAVAWFWSEVITMHFNPKKRAIHDFLGGTVVIEDAQSARKVTANPDSPSPAPAVNRTAVADTEAATAAVVAAAAV